MGRAPAGYSYEHSQGSRDQAIVPKEKAKRVKQAFLLWANEGLSNTGIANKISTAGMKVSNKRLTQIFRNPFYCGYISHSHLLGQIAKGKHEPIISREVFLKANDMLSRVAYGFKHQDKILILLSRILRDVRDANFQ